MSAQGELAAQDAFADDDELLSPDDRAPYELTDLARGYLRGVTDSGEAAAREESE